MNKRLRKISLNSKIWGIDVKWCCLCCGSRKKNRKVKSSPKKKIKNKDATKQIHALENIEEGIEGKGFLKLAMPFIWKLTSPWMCSAAS